MISTADMKRQDFGDWNHQPDDDLPHWATPLDSAQCRRAWRNDLHRLTLDEPIAVD